MIKTLIDGRNDVKMFKTQVEPLATGEWFHCNVLNKFLKKCIYKKNDKVFTLNHSHHQRKSRAF